MQMLRAKTPVLLLTSGQEKCAKVAKYIGLGLAAVHQAPTEVLLIPPKPCAIGRFKRACAGAFKAAFLASWKAINLLLTSKKSKIITKTGIKYRIFVRFW